MSDDRHTPHPDIHPAILEKIAGVAETAARAKGVAYRNRETLIELCGKSGKNGEVGHMRDDIDDVKEELKAQRRLLRRVIFAALGTTGVATAIAQVVIAFAK